MLGGFNCTIFAYGQTGTGKTYTMSGDMTESYGLLSDGAGIIPRVLQALFKKLEMEETENCVRCSFIELYNEELRDLLSADEGPKLKIYDDILWLGYVSSVVQGMEERHIASASEGIKRLQEGSLRRQVAATKCNDLSSRSHTVFTITVHVKRTLENGEDFVSAGKQNLVDLAGSENIQRSGAENKRAAEAGLINKSLLTLGRVINALVDRTSHVPYRESKLTRLLQDSLGGRTKTCIIATISPAKSNLEETISTLDYAFRAKNIRNKPQVNQLINKKTLLREFTAEIEKLKGELIATRQRNGVYLSNEAYEEMTVQNESRRILTEEQAARIATMENNLRNKVQELFDLTLCLLGFLKEHEGTKARLDDTKEVLDQTEKVLAATRRSLAEEAHLWMVHQETEEKLSALGGELIATLQRAAGDVDGMRAKSKRKSDLQSINRDAWGTSQDQVSEVTELVEGRIAEFRKSQEEHISSISQRMQSFVQGELEKLSSTQAFLDDNLSKFDSSREELLQQQAQSKEDMDSVLEEIKIVRDHIKSRVGDSLQAIASAAERIADDVLSELGTFHSQVSKRPRVRLGYSGGCAIADILPTQLHASYSSLGKDFRSVFEELLRHISSQRNESDNLRRQIEAAGDAAVQSNAAISDRIQTVVEEERRQAAEERRELLAQITNLIHAQAEAQESRLASKAEVIRSSVQDASRTLEGSVAVYSQGMDAWNKSEDELVSSIRKSRDDLKTKLKDDWTVRYYPHPPCHTIVSRRERANLFLTQAANGHSTSIQNTTKSVHAETIRVVDEQMKDLDVQMQDLDDFVARARSQNAQHLAQHSESVKRLSMTVGTSFSSISSHFKGTFGRVEGLGSSVDAGTSQLRETLEPLDEDVCQPLSNLRQDISSTVLREYQPTGETPERTQYHYPAELPRTEAHDVLIAGMTDAPTPSRAMPVIFNDMDRSEKARSPTRHTTIGVVDLGPPRNPLGMSLREMNPNLTTGSILFDPAASTLSLQPHDDDDDNTMPMFRRSTRLPKKHPKARNIVTMEGRENVPPTAYTQSASRKKNPRVH